MYLSMFAIKWKLSYNIFQILIHFQAGGFIVRENTRSDKNDRPFILSFNHYGKIKHATIRRNSQGYSLGTEVTMVRPSGDRQHSLRF